MAIEKLPEMQRKISEADTPYALWIELRGELNRVYKTQPFDESLVARIYGYAAWCMNQPRNDELRTAVVVCFYEHLPTDILVRNDVVRWLSVEEFTMLRPAFGYHLRDDEVEGFAREFFAQKQIKRFSPPKSPRKT